jgi:hypothetical protein
MLLALTAEPMCDDELSHLETFCLDEREISEDNICCICHCAFQATETLKILAGCRHFFHAVCIDTWLKN